MQWLMGVSREVKWGSKGGAKNCYKRPVLGIYGDSGKKPQMSDSVYDYVQLLLVSCVTS